MLFKLQNNYFLNTKKTLNVCDLITLEHVINEDIDEEHSLILRQLLMIICREKGQISSLFIDLTFPFSIGLYHLGQCFTKRKF